MTGQGGRPWWRRGGRPAAADTGEPVLHEAAVAREVTGLELPDPFDVRELVRLVAARRQRSIAVLPYPAHVVAQARAQHEPLPYGMWLAGSRQDFLFYREDTTAMHQQHVILHELGHICLRHRTESIDDLAAEEVTGDPATVLRAAKRTVYTDRQERAAELFAYLVEERAGSLHGGAGALDRDQDRVIRRYRSLLED
ncbi:ImmA/IrrE family metallo-endopeptidase [Crossiella sp. NPDC003009]